MFKILDENILTFNNFNATTYDIIPYDVTFVFDINFSHFFSDQRGVKIDPIAMFCGSGFLYFL